LISACLICALLDDELHDRRDVDGARAVVDAIDHPVRTQLRLRVAQTS